MAVKIRYCQYRKLKKKNVRGKAKLDIADFLILLVGMENEGHFGPKLKKKLELRI